MQAGRPPVLHSRNGPNAPPPEGPASAVFGRPVEAPAPLAGAGVLVVEDDNDSGRARAIEAGAADLLIKPFDPALLIARLAEAVAYGRGRPKS